MEIDGVEVIIGDRVYAPLLDDLSWYKRLLMRLKIIKPHTHGIYKVTEVGVGCEKS